MNKNFWNQKWQMNQIAFHEKQANKLLVKHYESLLLKMNSRIFIPLCGKTLDIDWLLKKGHRICAVELSTLAVEQLFKQLNMTAKITELSSHSHYAGENIDIFVGDIFTLSKEMLGRIDAIYDRAALVALPDNMRRDYSQHLMNITAKAPQLLISFEYNQAMLEGPPFSVTEEKIIQHYGQDYSITSLEKIEVADGLKGACAANESIWLLKNNLTD